MDPTTISFVDAEYTFANYGIMLMRVGEFGRAYDLLSSLRSGKKNKDPGIAFNLAITAYQLQKNREAKLLLTEYLETHPGDADGLI